MDSYELLGTIGEGTYGVVMKARHRSTGALVAIKKFKESDEDEQVRKTALREVRILKQLRHDNIVSLLEVFRKGGKLYLVFEFVDRTVLEELEARDQGSGMDPLMVKKLFYQLLKALHFIHQHNVIHRDVKPENLLLSRHGVLKLCDFGFARALARPGSRHTDYVATRWYRDPSLLCGDTSYGFAVDVWAVGCLFAELLSGQPLFPGSSDLDQLHLIMKTLGPLPQRYVDCFQANPLYVGVKLPAVGGVPGNAAFKPPDPLHKKLPHLDKQALSLLKACLRYDPEERDSCAKLLAHPYFAGFEENFRAEYKLAISRDREDRELLWKEYAKRKANSKAKRSHGTASTGEEAQAAAAAAATLHPTHSPRAVPAVSPSSSSPSPLPPAVTAASKASRVGSSSPRPSPSAAPSPSPQSRSAESKDGSGHKPKDNDAPIEPSTASPLRPASPQDDTLEAQLVPPTQTLPLLFNQLGSGHSARGTREPLPDPEEDESKQAAPPSSHPPRTSSPVVVVPSPPIPSKKPRRRSKKGGGGGGTSDEGGMLSGNDTARSHDTQTDSYEGDSFISDTDMDTTEAAAAAEANVTPMPVVTAVAPGGGVHKTKPSKKEREREKEREKEKELQRERERERRSSVPGLPSTKEARSRHKKDKDRDKDRDRERESDGEKRSGEFPSLRASLPMLTHASSLPFHGTDGEDTGEEESYLTRERRERDRERERERERDPFSPSLHLTSYASPARSSSPSPTAHSNPSLPLQMAASLPAASGAISSPSPPHTKKKKALTHQSSHSSQLHSELFYPQIGTNAGGANGGATGTGGHPPVTLAHASKSRAGVPLGGNSVSSADWSALSGGSFSSGPLPSSSSFNSTLPKMDDTSSSSSSPLAPRHGHSNSMGSGLASLLLSNGITGTPSGGGSQSGNSHKHGERVQSHSHKKSHPKGPPPGLPQFPAPSGGGGRYPPPLPRTHPPPLDATFALTTSTYGTGSAASTPTHASTAGGSVPSSFGLGPSSLASSGLSLSSSLFPSNHSKDAERDRSNPSVLSSLNGIVNGARHMGGGVVTAAAGPSSGAGTPVSGASPVILPPPSPLAEYGAYKKQSKHKVAPSNKYKSGTRL